jgi:hypothetical protein
LRLIELGLYVLLLLAPLIDSGRRNDHYFAKALNVIRVAA